MTIKRDKSFCTRLNCFLITAFVFVLSFGYTQTTQTFNYTGGSQSWTVPPCVYSITVTVAGAEGGGNQIQPGTGAGGNGAVITATINVNPGDNLTLLVGGAGGCGNNSGGFNGGGTGYTSTNGNNNYNSCGGGGSSNVIINGTPVIIAAGGGGSGGGSVTNNFGGNGGCAIGQAGGNTYGQGGGPGTQTAGGAYGAPWAGTPGAPAGGPGSLGQGGNGGKWQTASGGGGGGGYYGGGGGGNDGCCTGANGGGGGGGGSSLVPAGAGCTAGLNTGNGYISITYTGGQAVATASNSGPYCEGQTIQLSSTGGGTYSWTGPNGFTSTQQNPSIPASTPAMAGVYTVVVDNGACTATETTTVTVNPAPNVNNVTDQTVCSGNPVNGITFSGSVAGTTYSWINSNTNTGLAASGTGNIAAYTAPSVTTTQISTVTVTPTANGCTGPTETFTITIGPLPTVDPITDQALCQGDLTSAVNFTGNNPSTSYNWSNDNTNIGLAGSGTGNIAAFTAQNPGGTTVIGNITVTPSIGTCIGSTQTFSITVTPTPTVNPIADQVLCANLTTNAVTFTGNASGTTYSWTNSNTSIGLAASGTGNIAAFQGNNTGASSEVATITVTPTVGSCTGSAETFTITIDPVPNVDPITSQEICVGTTTAAINFTGSTAGASYSWTNSQPGIGLAGSGTGNIAPFTSVNTLGSPIVANITVTPSANGCSGPTGNFSITVNPLPVVNAGVDQVVCEGTTITLNGAGASNYVWNNGVTNGVGFIQNPGTTTYTLTGTDANGCVNSDVVDVTVNANPIINAGTDQIVCSGTSVTLSGSGASTYAWSNGVQDGVSFTPGVGTINYTVTGTDANGCVGTDDVLVTVNALPNVFAGADFLVCEGTSITLSGSGAQTYVWDNGAVNGSSFVQNPGVVTYTVTGTDANGCVNTDNITVTVEALPTVSFYATDLSGCAPFETALINTTPGNMDLCIWTLSNGASFSGCNSVPITIENGGLYDLTLTTTSINGCTNTATYDDYIYVENVPVAAFSPSWYELSALDPTVTFTNYSSGAVNYVWDFGDGGTSTLVNPTYAYQDEVEQTYVVQLIAISPIGCRDTAYQEVTVIEELIFYIPNTFTPDNDQFNQIFEPIFTSGHDPYNFNFYIFNRWGELIWESHNPDVGWDGTYGTSARFGYVPDGQYVWKLDFKIRKNDERVEYSGHVNVIR